MTGKVSPSVSEKLVLEGNGRTFLLEFTKFIKIRAAKEHLFLSPSVGKIAHNVGTNTVCLHNGIERNGLQSLSMDGFT